MKNKTKEEIIKLQNNFDTMDLSNFLKYLKNENRKRFDEEDIAGNILEEEEKRKRDNIKNTINEIEMEIENEKSKKEEVKKEEKNDDKSTIDEEINVIDKLNRNSEKKNIKYDLAF